MLSVYYSGRSRLLAGVDLLSVYYSGRSCLLAGVDLHSVYYSGTSRLLAGVVLQVQFPANYFPPSSPPHLPISSSLSVWGESGAKLLTVQLWLMAYMVI